MKISLKTKKIQGQAEDAEAKKLEESKLEDPLKEELKVTEKKELTENPAYGRHRISRPMGIIGPIQF